MIESERNPIRINGEGGRDVWNQSLSRNLQKPGLPKTMAIFDNTSAHSRLTTVCRLAK